MKRPVILLLILIKFAVGQTEITEKSVINSGDYYYGSGTSQIVNEAQDHALSELTKQIAVNVFTSFKEKVKESDKEVSETTEKILNSYSTATLRNVNFIKKPLSNGQVYVFCYLQKNEVKKIFQERKNLIHEIVEKAKLYEKENNYAYALKLYYFSIILLNSLPDENVIYQDINYTNELPALINDILLNIQFEYTGNNLLSDKEREITLDVTYKNKPVSLLDFNFWDGMNQVSVQARDGKAAFTLFGSSTDFDDLGISIKYSYYECKEEYAAVDQLWDLVKKPIFKSTIKVCLKGNPKVSVPKEELAETNTIVESKFSDTYNLSVYSKEEKAPTEKITKNTLHFLETLNLSKDKIQEIYGNDEFLANKLLNYKKFNHPKLQDKNLQAQIFAYDDGWELRRIRMLHNYPTIHKQTTEYLVLDFSVDGTLRDLNVAISENLYQRFVAEGDMVKDWYNRQRIIKFVEKYRTAYITRDIETIDKFFAEDALIIVGRRIEKKKFDVENVKYNKTANQPEYEYLQLKKQQYINRQKRIFKMQKDLFLDFASFEIVRKNNAPNVYGVEMRQNYHSTTYADEGYLFLLIDFEPADPTIYVRAWQPNAWSEEELIRTANFRVYK